MFYTAFAIQAEKSWVLLLNILFQLDSQWIFDWFLKQFDLTETDKYQWTQNSESDVLVKVPFLHCHGHQHSTNEQHV